MLKIVNYPIEPPPEEAIEVLPVNAFKDPLQRVLVDSVTVEDWDCRCFTINLMK